jgi:hypothetical protein
VNGAADLRSKPVQDMRIIDKRPMSTSVMDHIVNPIKDLFGMQSQPAASPNPLALPQGVPDVITNGALEMLDEELEYLDSQRDFEYELAMSPRGVLLTMQKLSRVQAAEDHVRFLFTVEDQQRIVRHGNHSYPFRKGIIEEVIGQMFY